MRLTKGVLIMGRTDTRRWEDRGPDGYAFRAEIRALANAHSEKIGRPVEIYASVERGGWMADIIGDRN